MPESQPSERGGLYEGFETYRTLSDSDYAQILKSALVVVDANVLLNLYRYRPDAQSAMTDVFQALGERLFVPHRALAEFWQNRERAATRPLEDVRASVAEVAKQFASVQEVLRQWVNRGALAEEASEVLRAGLESQAETLISEIESLVNPDDATANRNTARDPVLQALEPLLDGRVGPPMSADKYAAAVKEGKRRAEAGIPPGFGDLHKSKRDDPVGAAGDYLVWEQALMEAEARGLDVLFVTADMKPDWWRLEGTFQRGPRIELVDELRRRTGTRLFMMRPDALLSYAPAALSVAVDKASVAEVQRADSEVPEDAASLVGSVSLAARLSTAQTLWVKTGKLYGNLGNGLGNQLDMPRGTRIFFGCDADEVPRNTLLRHVSIQVPGFGAERRSIRFANNSMDKINLPRPGTNGPENYDDSYLIFDRSGVDADGVPSYKLTVTDLDGLEQRKASAIDWLDMEMSGGRPYGLMDFSGA